MYRQKKNLDDSQKSDGDDNEPEASIEAEDEAPSSTNPVKPPIVEVAPKSPKPDVVSSTLNVSPKDRQMSKSMAMLSQIFPGKSPKVLEIKLREAKGDVVKALESCAKYFDQVESGKTYSRGPSLHHQSPISSSESSISANFKMAPNNISGSGNAGNENNNNQNNDSAKFFPPFSTAAMQAAMALANSQHKSAFAPATTTTVASMASNPHAFYRGFDATTSAAAAATAAPSGFLPKELFPFPPPLFPPSFFVGFNAAPTYHHGAISPFNLALASAENIHRPCVDPLCNQCAPKVDSTDESAKEDCD